MLYFIIFLTAFWALFLIVHAARKRRDQAMVRKSISFDRIARLSDAGEKDIDFDIKGFDTYPWNEDRYKIYQVQFYYSCTESLRNPNNKNPMHRAGDPLPVNTYHSNTETEQTVAQNILQIKSLYKSN